MRARCPIFCVALALLSHLQLANALQFSVNAVVQKSPPQITLQWDTVPWGGGPYNVYRSTTIGGNPNTDGGGTWTTIASGLSATTTTYVDGNVQVGTSYEYRIERYGSSFNGNAYIQTGIEVPPIENRGKLVLVVDNTYVTNLYNEINQLIADLTGDGWVVVRHDVSRTQTPASVRSLIQTARSADSTVRAVYLLGRVPILRSGSLNVDGHAARLMPADGYYGDVDGTWSNPSYFPTDVDLEVGRVDLAGMTSFAPLTDVDLTRQYLNRAHGWKHKLWTVPTRHAMMSSSTGESIQRQFFGLTAATVIPNNYYAGNGYYSPEFWNDVENNAYLWFTKGGGGGAHDACVGMGSTYHYAASPGIKTVFHAEFASYFGEWDVNNSFLRAPLAAKGNGLTDVWSDNPAWVFMHMGMGKSIGYSTRVSQNNNTYYAVPGYGGNLPFSRRGVHMGLMGDPSLRMHIVAPPANLNAVDRTNRVDLTWTASSDSSLLGYAIYRSANTAGPFTRLNSTLATSPSYTDNSPGSGSVTYMVRAMKLEVTPSGSYHNLSQGIVKALTAGQGPVQPVVAQINSFERTRGGITLYWAGNWTARYQVQWKAVENSTNWNTFSLGTITSPDGNFSFLDDGSETASIGDSRYYRLLQIP